MVLLSQEAANALHAKGSLCVMQDGSQDHLDASVAEELLHAVPGGVSLAHQLEHPLQHIPDGIRRGFQGADLVQVVRLDLAHCQSGGFNDGSHYCQL